MDPLRGSTRLPIFRDDRTFSDRYGRGFRNMQRQMDEDWGRMNRPRWDDDFDRICEDFYHLKPTGSRLGGLRVEEFGPRASPDSLNGGNIVEDPSTKSRQFQISFNMKDYEPKDVAVRVEGDSLHVEAKHEAVKDGSKTMKEFSRCVKIPKEVEPDRLSSDLSLDGILTIKAPIPPGYHSVGAPSEHEYDSVKRLPPPGGHEPEAARAAPTLEAGSLPSPPPPAYTKAESGATATPTYTSTAFYQPTPPHREQRAAPSPPASRTTTSAASAKAASPRSSQETDIPMFKTTEQGRRMDLAVMIGPPYTPEDLVVKVEDQVLMIEATHERVTDGKRTSKSSTSREFHLAEDVDPDTVQASMGTDGILRITARVMSSDKK